MDGTSGAARGIRWAGRIIGIMNGLVWLSQVPGILVNSTIRLPVPLQVILLCLPLAAALAAFRYEIAGATTLTAWAAFFIAWPAIEAAAFETGKAYEIFGIVMTLPALAAAALFFVARRLDADR